MTRLALSAIAPALPLQAKTAILAARNGLPRMSDVIHSSFRIAPDHPALAGHFPGNPVVPGVVVLDRVAALAESHGVRIAGFVQAKFVAPLLPGEEARIELAASGERRRFRVLRGETVVASGDAEIA